ncbi:MAG: methionyl-tRNA synthetase [Frankiaceae bacterium]|jgi:methionyl-tRNA synthetase|nr:methionyl-tRNA synthetase [Frankiaceae bacterium]
MSEATGKAFYVTTPIYYVNDAPHIGHAYTTVAADVLARWHRQRGEDVWFLTGTDEHGEKVLRAAEKNGLTAQAWTDHMVETAWEPMLATLDVTNDDFIRTTQERHQVRVQEFWQRLNDAGHVYTGSYTGPYCVGCEEFKIASELLEGDLCPIHGYKVEQLSEDNYFFKLSSYAERLLEFYAANPDFVQPESARNEVIKFVEGGLTDLSITRSTFNWGVPVPWDPKHVLYVWIDALLNYVTAAGYGTDPEKFARTWPADVHLVGKDILRFHAVIWPAMLMAAELPLPHKVFAHGWLLVGGEKMSKTKLTGIAPQQITDHFGSDAFRYYFLRQIAFGQDGSFSWENMAQIYQSELGDQFGNLGSRLTSMVERYRDGVLPSGTLDAALADAMRTAVADADAAIERLAFQDALAAVMAFVRIVNGYVTEREPWKLAKDEANAGALDDVLYSTADALRAMAVLLSPVMPKACQLLWTSLGAESALGPLSSQRIAAVADVHLPAGAVVTKLAPLFPRLEEQPTVVPA